MRRTLIAALLGLGLTGGLASEVEGNWLEKARARRGKSCAPAGEPREVPAPDHDFCRAGRPDLVSRWSHPSNTLRFCGGYVGGGAALCAEPRYCTDGTWGWDYVGGCPFTHRVFLGWWHGRKYQGGSGAYRQDGPEFPPPLHVPELGKRLKEGH